MARDELKRLGRTDLLQLLLEAEEENEKLKAEVADLKQKLEDRIIQIEKSGSLADAALELNGVFAAAQAACKQYEDNIKRRSEGMEARCREMEQATEEKCRQMEKETGKRCRAREDETAKKCLRILNQIKEKYGDQVFDSVDQAKDAERKDRS